MHLSKTAINVLFFLSAACPVVAQSPQARATQPSEAQTQPPTQFARQDYLPLCSTEKLNGDCFINIDRRFPVSVPTYQIRRGSHITVCVFHPFAFETLTLDAGTIQAFEGSDQLAALVSAATPIGKGATWSIIDSAVKQGNVQLSIASMDSLSMELRTMETEPTVLSDATRAEKILSELRQLNDLLTQTLAPVAGYFAETNSIYAQIREVE